MVYGRHESTLTMVFKPTHTQGGAPPPCDYSFMVIFYVVPTKIRHFHGLPPLDTLVDQIWASERPFFGGGWEGISSFTAVLPWFSGVDFPFKTTP